jgi:cytochrome c553
MRHWLLTGLMIATAPALAQAQSVERGKYIVENLSLCGDCHTPRDHTGAPIAAEALHGAPIGFRPMHPMPFADQAPPLAGLPGHYTPEQMAAFLQTGKRPDGSEPRPPMPPYRMNHNDAWSVVRYLQTLKRPGM